MNTEPKLGAARAVFLSSASALPMLRGPTIAYAPEDDGGGAGDQGGGDTGEDNGAKASDQIDDNTGGDPAAAASEGEGGQPKPKQTAQERIDELTRARRDAERERDAATRERDELRAKVPVPEAPKEPKAADYTHGEDDAAYVYDKAKFDARQEYEASAAEAKARERVEAIETTWSDRQAAFAADKPDYYEKINAKDLPITPLMAAAIKTSEDGAAVAYHLATNPDEARRIAALDNLAQAREIGRLEATLAPPSSPKTPATKTVSDAPAPLQQLRGQGGRFQVAADTDDFEAFERTHSKT